MQDADFEWDDVKAAANLAAHSVSFAVARHAFADPFGIDRDDFRETYGEPRYSFLEMVADRIIYVAYTERDGRTRIIMARAAEPFERRLYHDANTQR